MKRVLKVALFATGSMFLFALIWLEVECYSAYRNAPPGWIVDYGMPHYVELIGHIGLVGFGLVLIIWIIMAVKEKLVS
jgi:hypothetical protein